MNITLVQNCINDEVKMSFYGVIKIQGYFVDFLNVSLVHCHSHCALVHVTTS